MGAAKFTQEKQQDLIDEVGGDAQLSSTKLLPHAQHARANPMVQISKESASL